MHLWVWLDAPLGGDELKRWAIAANQSAGYKLIDPALFSAVQAHYVAAPDFVAPLPDPLPRRCGLRQGLDDSVSLIIPPRHPKRRDEPGTEGYDPGRGVKAYLDMIGGPMGFREPIKKAIASYIAIHGSGADCGPLKAAIREALDRAEPDWRNDPKGARYIDDEHLDAIIDAIRAFQGDKPGRGFIPEPPPEFDDPPPAEPDDRDETDPDPQTKTSARCRWSSATRRWRYNSPLTITPTGATPHCGASGCSGSAPIGAAKTHCGPSNWRGGSAAAIAPRPL
jgi:hypothetical protein